MDTGTRNDITALVREKSRELGFDICGIAPPRVLDKNREILRVWCEAGMNAGMSYLERNGEKRADPRIHLPGVKSLIVTGMSYNSINLQKNEGVPVISRYAYGKRYQDVISEKLRELLAFIKIHDDNAEGRIVVDSSPLFEKAWAVEAGLGWQGKHSVIINKEIGSFFFLGVLMINITLGYDKPASRDHCGNCRLCIDGCPTGAINDNRTIDARKCISNLTIENREPVSKELGPKLRKRVYGCDICQELCPWNQKAPRNIHPEFSLSDEVANLTRKEWLDLSEERFKRIFRETPVERIRYSDFIQNVRLVIKS